MPQQIEIIESLGVFLPEIVLTASLCIVILAGLIFRKSGTVPALIALVGTAAAGILSLSQTGMNQSLFTSMVAADSFAAFFKVFVSVCTMFVILFSMHSSEVRTSVKRIGEYYGLLLALTLGMFLTVSATNILMLVLAIETMGLSSYVLAGFTKEAPDSSEASLKYVIYGAVSTGMMLYGLSLLYGLTGALTYSAINASLAQGTAAYVPLLVATILIFVGFGYKISAVPFHFWTPDVYQGAPITITAFLSVASKAAGFAAMMRFVKVIFIDENAIGLPAGLWAAVQGAEWYNIVLILSVLTMTLGNLVALWQDNMKRLLAYSSIAHAGYMLMGVVVMSDSGFAAVLIYFVMYLFMNLGAFYIVMYVADRTGSEDIRSYKGLGFRAPFIGVSLVIFLIALTGLPPTAGFIGKLYLFSAVLDVKLVWLAVVGALNSVISLYYYARVIRNVFLREPSEEKFDLKPGLAHTITILLLLVPTLLFGLYFSPVVSAATHAVQMFGVR